ncbi:unnamed protein product, partial [Iphiclides podalirius]
MAHNKRGGREDRYLRLLFNWNAHADLRYICSKDVLSRRARTTPADNTELSFRLNKFSSGDAIAYLFGRMWACLGALSATIKRPPRRPAAPRKVDRGREWAYKPRCPIKLVAA